MFLETSRMASFDDVEPCVGLKPWSGFKCMVEFMVAGSDQKEEVATTNEPNGATGASGRQSTCTITAKICTFVWSANCKTMTPTKDVSRVAEESPTEVQDVEEYDGSEVKVTKSFFKGKDDFEGATLVRFNVVFEPMWYYHVYDGDMDLTIYETNKVMAETEAEYYAEVEADAYARGFINSFEKFRGDNNE